MEFTRKGIRPVTGFFDIGIRAQMIAVRQDNRFRRVNRKAYIPHPLLPRITQPAKDKPDQAAPRHTAGLSLPFRFRMSRGW